MTVRRASADDSESYARQTMFFDLARIGLGSLEASHTLLQACPGR